MTVRWRRQLSWHFPFWVKAFLGIWCVGWGLGTLQMLLPSLWPSWLGHPEPAGRGEGILVLVVWIGVVAALHFASRRTMKVVIENDSLVVSSHFRTVRVPLAHVQRVRRSWFGSAAVTVDFEPPTRFGRRIGFIANGPLGAMDVLPEPAEALSRLAAEARRLNDGPAESPALAPELMGDPLPPDLRPF